MRKKISPHSKHKNLKSNGLLTHAYSCKVYSLCFIATQIIYSISSVESAVVLWLPDGLSNSSWPFYRSELFMLWRLRSLTGCAVGVWPTRSPQRQPATDLPVLSADSVSQGPLNPKGHQSQSLQTHKDEKLEKCLDSY